MHYLPGKTKQPVYYDVFSKKKPNENQEEKGFLPKDTAAKLNTSNVVRFMSVQSSPCAPLLLVTYRYAAGIAISFPLDFQVP